MYEHFARFRTGNHRFPYETGRYKGVDYAERKCRLCNMQDVGDEMHYLLICPCFQNDREKYIKSTFTRDQIFSSSGNLCLQTSYLF